MLDTPFHLAFPVHDLSRTKDFYHGILGCRIGRESANWVDFDFFGHQLSAHLSPPCANREPGSAEQDETSEVDGIRVPLRHFGVILPLARWHELARTLEHRAVSFLIPPTTRYPGLAGEQNTFFVLDPSANGLEFKAFRDPADIYRTDA